MVRRLAFIKSNASLLIFHRFKERHGLTLAHLTFFFRLGLGSLYTFVWWFLGFVRSSPLDLTGEFFLRRFLRSSGRCRVLTFTLTRGRRRRFVFSFARAG